MRTQEVIDLMNEEESRKTTDEAKDGGKEEIFDIIEQEYFNPITGVTIKFFDNKKVFEKIKEKYGQGGCV